MAEAGVCGKMEVMSEQAVAGKWNLMRSELNQLYGKITELEQKLNEHQLVINALQPLDPGRKCFRMIGGVLVERTVGEVLPAVTRNKEGLQEVISRLAEALGKKRKEFVEFESTHKIKVRRVDDAVVETGAEESSAQGVLV